MKRKVLLIVASLLLGGTLFAQDFHWSGFNYHDYTSNMPVTGRVYLDGVIQQDRGDIEVAAFVGDELRGTKFLWQPYPQSNLGYFIWTAAYFDAPGETFTFKAFDHASGIEYDVCPTQLVGQDGGHGSVDNPIEMYFTSSHVPFVAPTYPWTPVTGYQGEGMLVVAQIQINGELVDSENWEVGAFCNNECRGICDGLDDWTVDNLGYFAFMNVVGNDGDVIEFYLYDKSNSVVYEALCTTTVDLVNGGELGIDIYGGDIFVLNFVTEQTYTKTINAYSGNGGYYLIASPVGAVAPTAVQNMLLNNYDLYYFDQTQELEWINYEDTSNEFTQLLPGKGYLYANSQTVQLKFTGYPYTDGTVTLTYSDVNPDANMHGWNLVGNPFTQAAYINLDMPFYTLDGDDDYVEHAAGDAIDRMQGILVHTDAETTLTFSTTAPSKSANLALILSQDRGIIDRAIVNFGEGRQLPKFQLNPNHTKVYMPVEGKDYAVANAENEGEMPVNFKAEKNGSYTISVSAQEVDFRYLHLIDNMTGADIDLLETPSYTFNANTTDYASRFRLVFITGNAEDHFTFFNGSTWFINNEGKATLQVIDVTGRIISSETINGCANVNIDEAPGVYMMRLIKGDNVKVQKIVVK